MLVEQAGAEVCQAKDSLSYLPTSVNKSWTYYESIMNNLWTSHEQVITYEQVIDKKWASH